MLRHDLEIAALRRPVVVLASVLMIVCTVIPGCGARPITGPMFKNDRSYDYEGQKVELNMLTYDDVRDYAKTHTEALVDKGAMTQEQAQDIKTEWTNRLNADFPQLTWDTELAFPILAPIAIGYAIDLAKAELEKEASLYEAQYGASIHETGFWKSFRPINRMVRNEQGRDEEKIVGYEGEPRWLGFEIVRRTAGDENDDNRPASRIAFAMISARYYKRHNDGPPKQGRIAVMSDERLFVIKPLWLEVNRTRAKVAQFEKSVDLATNIRMNAIWIDPAQGVHRDSIADAKFELSGVDLSDRTITINGLKNKIAGWFAGVPVSFDAETKIPKGDGTFELAVTVTETDPSKVREIIERAAKYLGGNKDKIVQKFGGGDG